MATPVYEQLLAQLSPYVGTQMARAIVNSHCQSMGLTPTDLCASNLEPLVQKLETALKAFLGGMRASMVVATIGKQP